MQAHCFGLAFAPAKLLGLAALAWLGGGCAAQVEANDGGDVASPANGGGNGNGGGEGNAGNGGSDALDPSLPDNIGVLKGRLVGDESEPIRMDSAIAVIWDWKDPIAHDL